MIEFAGLKKNWLTGVSTIKLTKNTSKKNTTNKLTAQQQYMQMKQYWKLASASVKGKRSMIF